VVAPPSAWLASSTICAPAPKQSCRTTDVIPVATGPLVRRRSHYDTGCTYVDQALPALQTGDADQRESIGMLQDERSNDMTFKADPNAARIGPPMRGEETATGSRITPVTIPGSISIPADAPPCPGRSPPRRLLQQQEDELVNWNGANPQGHTEMASASCVGE